MFSDWLGYFWPQIQNPWVLQRGVFNLPWLFILLQPLRLFGPHAGVIIIEVVSIFVVIKIGMLLKLSVWRILLVLFSPPMLWNIYMGQVDGLLMLAYLVPPYFAVFLTLAKPQSNFGAGLKAVFLQPWSLTIILSLLISSWVIWGWPFSITQPAVGGPFKASMWNWSYWPFGLLSAPLLFIKDIRGRIFASPFIFPYAGLQSLIGPMLVIATLPYWVALPLWAASWVRWAYMLNFLH